MSWASPHFFPASRLRVDRCRAALFVSLSPCFNHLSLLSNFTPRYTALYVRVNLVDSEKSRYSVFVVFLTILFVVAHFSGFDRTLFRHASNASISLVTRSTRSSTYRRAPTPGSHSNSMSIYVDDKLRRSNHGTLLQALSCSLTLRNGSFIPYPEESSVRKGFNCFQEVSADSVGYQLHYKPSSPHPVICLPEVNRRRLSALFSVKILSNAMGKSSHLFCCLSISL